MRIAVIAMFLVVLFLLIGGLASLYDDGTNYVRSVRDGSHKLYCRYAGVLHEINPNEVLWRDDRGWVWRNGSSSQCTVIKGEAQ